MSEGPRVGAAVHQQILAGNVPRLRAAEKGAGITELLGGAASARGIGVGTNLAKLGGGLANLLRVEFEVGAQPVGLERPCKQVIDGVVVAPGGARQARDEAGEAGARAVGKAELRDRRLDGG